jgi:hypothetical protein
VVLNQRTAFLPCCTSCSDPQAAAHGAGFPAAGGLFAKEAIQLLQDFYIAGNPAGEAKGSSSSNQLA